MASELSASGQEFGSKYSCRETIPQIRIPCVQECHCSGNVSRKELRALCTVWDCCKGLSYVKADQLERLHGSEERAFLTSPNLEQRGHAGDGIVITLRKTF